jgi:sugar (pentulose or hexulose) kinase
MSQAPIFENLMTARPRMAAFDLGAESGRIFVGTTEGDRLRIEEIYRFPNEPVQYNGELHWDIGRLWLEILRGLHQIGARGLQLSSLGLDTWGVDYALLGKGGRLLESPFHYRDRRTVGAVDKVLQKISRERIYKITGIQFMPINTLYQLYVQNETCPELLQIAERLVTIPDLFNFWLSGEVCCEYTNASTTQLLDVRTRLWSQELIEALDLPKHIFGPIVGTGTVLGPLKSEISSLSACGDPILVAPACHDTGSAFAAIYPQGEIAVLSSGTWSLLGAELSSPITIDAAREHNFTNEGGAGDSYRLLKNIAGLWLLQRFRLDWSAARGTISYNALVDQAAEATAFRHFINPDDPSFLLPENMVNAIDAFLTATGQTLPPDPGSYARAIFEGLAFRYRAVLGELEELTGKSYAGIRVVGGGSRNALLNQLTADATGRRVLAGPVEAAVLGNMAMQMVATNEVTSLQAARAIINASFPPEVYEPRNAVAWHRSFEKFLDHTERARKRNDAQSYISQRSMDR